MTGRIALYAGLIAYIGFRASALEVYTQKQIANHVASREEVDEHANEIVYWRDRGERTLTYWIDRASFRTPEEADRVKTDLQLAGKDWSDACPKCDIRFEPSQEEPTATFKVQRTRRSVLADSFFPNYIHKKRHLLVGDLFFTSAEKYDQVGVLRHELGHILGYRHEHLRTVRAEQHACRWEPDFKKRTFLPLTPYDADSVMHYPCSGAKEKAYFRLSPLDIEGHRKLYGP